MKPPTKRRCTQLTQSGQPCRAWALRDSDPPICAIHAGRVIGQGAPQGNRNAVTHGFYAAQERPSPDQPTEPPSGDSFRAALDRLSLDQPVEPPSIDSIIDDLLARQAQLSAIIDDHLDQLDIQDLVRLFALHGQNASRLGRLLYVRHSLLGAGPDRLQQFMDHWLDVMSERLGLEL